jgi:hypothetical protein
MATGGNVYSKTAFSARIIYIWAAPNATESDTKEF